MKNTFLGLVLFAVSHQAYAGTVREVAQLAEQQLNCKIKGSQGIQLISNTAVFSGRCNGDGIVGHEQADKSWVFKNCGPVTADEIPKLPKVSLEHLSKMFDLRAELLKSDYCNLWKPLIIPASWVQVQKQEEVNAKEQREKWQSEMKQQTGCDVSGIMSIRLFGVDQTTIQLVCPNNQFKVARAVSGKPLEVKECKTPQDAGVFSNSDGEMFCGHMK